MMFLADTIQGSHRYVAYQLVYVKACNLPFELEHKAMLAMM